MRKRRKQRKQYPKFNEKERAIRRLQKLIFMVEYIQENGACTYHQWKSNVPDHLTPHLRKQLGFLMKHHVVRPYSVRTQRMYAIVDGCPVNQYIREWQELIDVIKGTMKCLLCRCKGTEIYRESCIHWSGKLAERVTFSCPVCDVEFARFDHSIRDYTGEDALHSGKGHPKVRAMVATVFSAEDRRLNVGKPYSRSGG